jgi:hypothetical protein
VSLSLSSGALYYSSRPLTSDPVRRGQKFYVPRWSTTFDIHYPGGLPPTPWRDDIRTRAQAELVKEFSRRNGHVLT